MATTYEAIATVEVGSGGAANIEFTSIPATYTDLVLKISVRSTESDTASSLRVFYNSDTSNISVREARAVNTTAASYTTSVAQVGYAGASLSTADTFGSTDVYIPNYTGSANKASSGDSAMVSTTAGNSHLVLSARLWSDSAAITSITVGTGLGTLVEYSTATLYGIKNS
jgi:hypothetical protein